MKLATTFSAPRRSLPPLPLGEGWGEGAHGARSATAADPHPNPPPQAGEGVAPALVSSAAGGAQRNG